MMIRILSTTLTLVAVLAPLTAQNKEAVGKPKTTEAKPEAAAPAVLQLGGKADADIVLDDIDGKAWKTADLAGHLTVVTFWSTTCPIMAGWEGTLSKIHADYGGKGVDFVMINANEGNGEIDDRQPQGEAKPYQKIRDHLRKKQLAYRVLPDHDSIVAGKFGAKTTPDVFVFNKDAELIYRGLIDDDLRGDKGEAATHHLRDTLDALLLGKFLRPSETKPHGCGIKKPRKDKGTAPVKKADRVDR